MRPRGFRVRLAGLLVALASVAGMAACGSISVTNSPGHVTVAAAENVWGSIATQLGGAHVVVTSVITNPATDPHAYEPTPADTRTLATSQLVLINGAGYDPWAQRVIDANPATGRTVLNVGELAGRHEGDNPHMWYDPAIVLQVVDTITADYTAIDPVDAAYFTAQAEDFKARNLQQYNDLRATIKSRYSGVAIGATESIFVDMASDLGLDILTPSGYMKAMSEGNDPSASDKSTVDAQIARRQIQVLVYNTQNSTPDVQTLVDAAHAHGIPVVAITETLEPASATFEAWQVTQLQALQAALAEATGR